MKQVRAEPVADTAPRYALAWAMLICAIAALTLAYPALTGGFLVNPRSDQYIAGFAFRDFAAQSLHTDGHFPLWNPYLFGGLPYVDAMHGDIFYPTFLLRMILPTDLAMTWGMILHFWLAGVAAYAFFRANRLSFGASLIGGLGYMMSGQVAGLVSPGHDGKLFITALLPLALLVLRIGMRDGKRWAWGALALVVGLAILTPHPQLLQYMLLASGAYALWLAYFEGGGGPSSRRCNETPVRIAGFDRGWTDDRRDSVPPAQAIHPVVTTVSRPRVGESDVVFHASGRNDQLGAAAVLRDSRELLGQKQDSFSLGISGFSASAPGRPRIHHGGGAQATADVVRDGYGCPVMALVHGRIYSAL